MNRSESAISFHCAECIREGRSLPHGNRYLVVNPRVSAGAVVRAASPRYFGSPNALLAHYVYAHPRATKTMPWLNAMREELSQSEETA